jgi:capsular exopolysaccharide synthesis family protein
MTPTQDPENPNTQYGADYYGAPEPGSEFKDLINKLLDRAWLISLCVIVALLAAAVHYKRAPRIYQATATAQVEQEEQRVVKVEQVVKEDLRTVEVLNTIVQKLHSQPLLERVLQTNGITNIASLFGKKPQTNDSEMSSEQLSDVFAGMVKTILRRNTRLIDVTVSNPDPQLTAKLANSILELYMTLDFEARSTTTKGAFTFLNDESIRLKKKLEASEQALQAYREEVGSVSMMQSGDFVLPQLTELSLRVSQAKSEVVRLKSSYEQVNAARSNLTEMLTAPLIVADPAVADARALMTKLENDFALIQQRYKSLHPKYLQATTTLEEARRGLNTAVYKAADSLKVAYENAMTTQKGMENSFREAQDNALKVSQQAIRYNVLAREVESDQALFDSVVNRLKETSLTTDFQPEKIRVVEPASVPRAPASPKLQIIFGAALIGGLMVGCALAFGLGMLDSSIKGVDDAEQYLQLPVLASIPRLREVKKRGKNLVAADGSTSQGAEAFRTLRTALTMLGRQEDRRTFLFTSALPSEGKSFCSLNFAVSLAQQGLRTLLIDADLRRPSIGEYLEDEADEADEECPGLTDYLLGRKNLSEVVRSVKGMDCFFWLPAGKLAPNPAELLGQEQFGGLINEALKSYDRVVIDSAPIHAVSDTLLIAKKAQTIVLVLHGGVTPRKPVLRCVQLLQNAGAQMGGVVMNLLSHRRSNAYGYYDSYYYYGHHGYYGKDGKRKKHSHRHETASAKVEMVKAQNEKIVK